MLASIPYELQVLPQWVIAGPDKVPHNPKNGHRADVMDPATWGSYEQACACCWPFVGFVLTEQDPYCIIDLDNPAMTNGQPETDLAIVAKREQRFRKITEHFKTYAELSQSEKGLHIVCRARVPRGVRRDRVEIYSSGRYMIFTGKVVNPMPIADCQELVDMLFAEMDTTPLPVKQLVQIDSVNTDEQVFRLAESASNSAKFLKLWHGDWQNDWPSQSEADFALLSMLAFYSKDNNQVMRLFRYSALGKREKAQRNDYLLRMIAKMRAKELPQIDLSNLLNHAQKTKEPDQRNQDLQVETKPESAQASVSIVEPEAKKTAKASDCEFPPGFVGECANYFFSSAIRPVKEIALATSIALLGGVTGRSYNISGSGLNQYIVLLAKTGSGKEGTSKGIDSMISAIRPRIPMADEFVGPSTFASGQALIRCLDKQACFVSVLGEFGFTLQAISDPRATTAEEMLRKVLLDIYAKSGFNNVLRPSVYSQVEKNTNAIRAPNVTILGESTPEMFYDGLDASSIAQGLIPRFSIFEYEGPRPNRNPNAFHLPPKELVDRFELIVATSLAARQNQVHCPVMLTPTAQAMLDAFDNYATDEINKGGSDIVNQLWNRAHLKALKLAALVAVGVNPAQPVVDDAAASWACRCVENDVSKLLAKFIDGGVGTGDGRLESDMRRAFLDYASFGPKTRAGYDVPASLLEAPIVPLCYLRRRLRNLVSYRNDKRGSNAAIAATLKALQETNEIQQVIPLQVRQSYNTVMPCYVLTTGNY